MQIREVIEKTFHDYEIDPFETPVVRPAWLHGIIRVRKLKKLTPTGYVWGPAFVECNRLNHLNAEESKQVIHGLSKAVELAEALDIKYKVELQKEQEKHESEDEKILKRWNTWAMSTHGR